MDILITGLLTLLGVCVGALLMRRTEYEKWLRQERSLTYAAFLREVLGVRHKALNIIHSQLPLAQRDMEITELFMELEISKQIVRLYLLPSDRSRFDTLANSLRAALSPTNEQEIRMRESNLIFLEFQSIFETTLDGHHQKLWNKVVA